MNDQAEKERQESLEYQKKGRKNTATTFYLPQTFTLIYCPMKSTMRFYMDIIDVKAKESRTSIIDEEAYLNMVGIDGSQPSETEIEYRRSLLS